MDLSKKMMFWNHCGCINFNEMFTTATCYKPFCFGGGCGSLPALTGGGHPVVKAESSQLGVYALAFFWYRIYRWFGEGWTSNIYRLYRAEFTYTLHTYTVGTNILYLYHTESIWSSWFPSPTFFEHSPLDARTNLRSAWDKIRVPVGPRQGGQCWVKLLLPSSPILGTAKPCSWM